MKHSVLAVARCCTNSSSHRQVRSFLPTTVVTQQNHQRNHQSLRSGRCPIFDAHGDLLLSGGLPCLTLGTGALLLRHICTVRANQPTSAKRKAKRSARISPTNKQLTDNP